MMVMLDLSVAAVEAFAVVIGRRLGVSLSTPDRAMLNDSVQAASDHAKEQTPLLW